MSKRKPLEKSDLPDELKSTLKNLSNEYSKDIADIFAKFQIRRTNYGFKACNFKPNVYEFIIKDLFVSVAVMGEIMKKPKENKVGFKNIFNLADIFNKVGITTSKEEILQNIAEIHKTKVAHGCFVEIIPHFVYGYISRSKPNDLILKTEYQFGCLVLDSLELNKGKTKKT